jgi:putative transposase
MGLDLAQALLRSAFAGETLSGVGSGNVTEEIWAGWIKNQTPPKPDDDFKVI